MARVNLLSLPSSVREAAALGRGAGLRVRAIRIAAFPDGDVRLRLPSLPPRGARAVVVAGGADWRAIGELLMAIRALREHGIRAEAFFPLFPYSRADRAAPREPKTAHLVADLLRAAGCGGAAVIAPHAVGPLARLGRRPRIVEPLPQIASSFCEKWKPDTVLAPDRGAFARATAVARNLRVPAVAFVEKRRSASGAVRALGMRGKVGRRVLIVDDIVSTGATLVAAARLAASRGATDVRAVAVHGTFGPETLRQLRRSPIRTLAVSDSRQVSRSRQVVVIPILEAIGKLLYAP